MATKNIKLTRDWVQITDGSQYCYLQVIRGGGAQVCDADAIPDANHAYQIVWDDLNVAPPAVIWARSTSNENIVILAVTISN